MNNELKEQLNDISEKDGANFSLHVKSILQTEDAGAIAESLKNFILRVPDLITQIRIQMNNPLIPARYKELLGFAVTYLYQDEDFLPDTGNGLFGYLDDAYIIGSVYSMTMKDGGFGSHNSIFKLKSEKEVVPQWLEATRKVIPGETAKIDEMLFEILQGKPESFRQMMNGSHLTTK